MKQSLVIPLVFLAVCPSYADAVDLSLTTQPYQTGGLFADQLLPQEGDSVTITVRADIAGPLATDQVAAILEIVSEKGPVALRADMTLKVTGSQAAGQWQWQTGPNGLYTVSVALDPANVIDETCEMNNLGSIQLPVLKKGVELFFPCYRERGGMRWCTGIGTANEAEQRDRLNERGILGLYWEFAGASWPYHDQLVEQEGMEALLQKIDEIFYGKFSAKNEMVGYGLDETICSELDASDLRCQKSIASLKALVRGRSVNSGKFYMVWHAGQLPEALAEQMRLSVDLVCYERYVLRRVYERGLDSGYQVLTETIEHLQKLGHLIEKSDDNICYTVIALDCSEMPMAFSPVDMEALVRHIRRICPEMHGIAWYDGGYGDYILQPSDLTPVTDARHELSLRTASDLNLRYFIKPCITLDRGAFKIEKDQQAGKATITAVVRNIGGMDSGPVEVSFRANNEELSRQKIDIIAGGYDQQKNRVTLSAVIDIKPDTDRIEAVIVSAPYATVLDDRLGEFPDAFLKKRFKMIPAGF